VVALNSDLLERWQEDAKIRGLTPGTINTYRISLQDFKRFLGNIELLEANKLVIRSYIEHLRARGLKAKTVEQYMIAISGFYRWAQFEDLTTANPTIGIRERYLRRFKTAGEQHTHKLITVAEAARLIDALVDIRDKAIVLLMLKTGIRRGELLSLEIGDINWREHSITLKPVAKRTNRVVFFDDEMARILRRWLAVRQERNRTGTQALWISSWGSQIHREIVSYMIEKAALQCGLHDPKSDKMEDHFSAHCCRHWFTTHLRRAGMPREFIQELRGDARKEAIDIYDHIDKEELRRSYLAHIPQLGV
jgi:integrase/recombinase XerD